MTKHAITGKEALAELDARHCVLQIQGKVRIVGFEPVETVEIGNSKRAISMPVYSSRTDMALLYSNQFIDVAGGDGEPKRKPLFDYWLARKDRPTAVGFDMVAGGARVVDGKFNLWQGFAIEPKKGKWSKLYFHISEVIGASYAAPETVYLFQWVAWVLQHPTQAAEVILVLQGDKGTGKGEFLRLLWYIFGAHALQISDRKHLVGSFNRHLQQVCFLYADEAFWPGDKAGEGVLKRLATEPTLTIEPKGIDAYEAPNRLSIAMSSNERWIVPASARERRYAVLTVSSRHQQDFEYFADLRREIYEEGGAEAFLHEMLATDLKGWHPRMDIPVTQALKDQQDESSDGLVQWAGEILDEGSLPSHIRDSSGMVHRVVHKTDPSRARSAMLLAHARRSLPKMHLSPAKFWAFLAKLGVKQCDTERRDGRWRKFPPLEEARAAFTKEFPWKSEWSSADDWWMAETATRLDDYDFTGPEE